MSQDKTAFYMDQFKANKMNVLPPNDTLKTGLKKIGDQFTADWQKRAGADGEAVIAAYRKM